MNTKEVSQIKENDVVYDKSTGMAYNVIKTYKSGVLAYWEWINPYGRFTENKYLKHEELLCKNMMLM